jgi:hypothetical protein
LGDGPSAISLAPSALDDALRRAGEVTQHLADARERAQVLESAALELQFTGPRETGTQGVRKPKVLRRIAVAFGQRIKPTRKNGRSVIVLQLGPANEQGKPEGLTVVSRALSPLEHRALS